MKRIMKFSIILATVAVIFSSCTENSTNSTEPSESQQQEVEAVTNIIAGSLSDKNEGFMASMYDLTANVTPGGMGYRNNRDWRGGRDFEFTYDEETGTHSINFEREISRGDFSKSMQASLNYKYRDANGGFIPEPAEQQSQIASIGFEGQREGATQTPRRNSSFERTASWFLEGYNENIMQLSGEQQHSGNMTLSTNFREISRNFDVQFNLIDITIERSDSSDELEYLITGLIEYSMTTESVINGETRSQNFEGVIELTGEGDALMRIMGLNSVYRLDLINGEVLEER